MVKMKNGRLIIAVLTSLLDEALIVFGILWGLPKLGVAIPLWGTILICAGFLTYAVVFYRAGSRALIRKPVKGFTDQIGMEGKTVTSLRPKGTVMISGELWEARAENGEIEKGIKVEVVGQKGMKVIVRGFNRKPATFKN
jgi:membrane-bound ClpP family serine protease